MGLTVTKERSEEDVVEYSLEFRTGRDSSYSFACTETGVVDIKKLPLVARINYDRCVNGEFGQGEIKRTERTVVTQAEGKCHCGNILTMGRGDMQCTCGRMYNSFGQEITRMGYEDLPGEDY